MFISTNIIFIYKIIKFLIRCEILLIILYSLFCVLEFCTNIPSSGTLPLAPAPGCQGGLDSPSPVCRSVNSLICLSFLPTIPCLLLMCLSFQLNTPVLPI